MLIKAFWALFPFAREGSADDYAKRYLEDPTQKANINKLNIAAASATEEARLKELRDIADSKRADEEARQVSIITRAQGLFVALALFGFLLTFGANLFTSTNNINRSSLAACSVIVIYVLLQMIIMMINILQAIGGLGYPTAGSSDLASWLQTNDDCEFYRAQALLTLSHYRRSALNNSWRFVYLTHALRALRNVIFALSLLILIFFAFALVHHPQGPDPLCFVRT